MQRGTRYRPMSVRRSVHLSVCHNPESYEKGQTYQKQCPTIAYGLFFSDAKNVGEIASWGQLQRGAKYTLLLLFLLFWYARLGVRSAILRHHPPQRTVLGQVDCFVQWGCRLSDLAGRCSVTWYTRTPLWCLPVIWWGAVRIILVSASSIIRVFVQYAQIRKDAVTVRLGCLVVLLISLLRTDWCHLIPNSVFKHHWSTASIVRASTLVTAQQMHVG